MSIATRSRPDPQIKKEDSEDRGEVLTPLCHIVTPTGMLGYGVNKEETTQVLERLVPTGVPTAIIIDGGSTDSGPSKLALGTTTAPREAYVRDLTQLLHLVYKFRVPLIFSSAGGDGSNDHVCFMRDIIEEICSLKENKDYRFKVLEIFSEVSHNLVLDRMRQGKISGCGTAVPPLTEDAVKKSPRIVAQLGPEPFLDVMCAHPDFDIIVAGRAYDPAPHVGYAAWLAGSVGEDDYREGTLGSERAKRNFGAFTHVGKILECGGVCAEPKSLGAYATIYRGCAESSGSAAFDVTPIDPTAHCTPLSVGAHTLYEKSRPDILQGPGGALDLRYSSFEQLADGRTVRVRGSLFHFDSAAGDGRPFYQLKLEAARIIGYRSLCMGSFHDPILIAQIDNLLERVKNYVAMQHKNIEGTWDLGFHVYGRHTSEVFLVAEALGSTQEIATSVANVARIACTHGSYFGQRATSGNLAFGIGGKMEIECGPCPEFSIYHLMDLEPGEERLAKSHHVNDHTKRMNIQHSVSMVGKGPDRQKPPITSPAINLTPADPATNGSSEQPSAQTGAHPRTGTPTRESVDDRNPPVVLGDIARVRSKNAGPFEITYDALFDSEAEYNLVKQSWALHNERVCKAIGLENESDVIWSGFFDPAHAYKITAPRLRDGRRVASGSFMEGDVHASQKYIGLMNLPLPAELIKKLVKLRSGDLANVTKGV